MSPYAERLLPRGWTWGLAPALGLLSVLSAVALGTPVAVAVGFAVTVAVVALLVVVSPRLQVDADGFRAGSAFLDSASVGDVDVLTGAQVRLAMGPELRADAHVVYRGWVRGAVRVHVRDDADPTPYWLVSTNRPAALAHALGAGAADPGDLPDPEGQAAHSEHTG